MACVHCSALQCIAAVDPFQAPTSAHLTPNPCMYLWMSASRQSGPQLHQAPLPARPWERRQHQLQAEGAPQHPSSTPAQPEQQQHQQQTLLQQAADAVQRSLHQAALTAQADPCGAAAVAASKLFVPAVLFLAAALTAAEGEEGSGGCCAGGLVQDACQHTAWPVWP